VILPRSASADFDRPVAIPRVVVVVGIVGVVPLVLIAVVSWIPTAAFSLPDIYLAGLTYAAVALSFLGGARWGAAASPSAGDLFISALPPIAGWVALLIAPLIGLCLLIAAFFLQALWTVVTVEKGALPLWFGKFSTLFASGAVMALIAMLLKLIT
jgi:hypothetical protein